MSMLFEFSIQGALILALAYLVILMLRRASASLRHLVLSCAGIALLLLPIASLALPKLRIPIPAKMPTDAPLLFGITVTPTGSAPGAKTGDSSSALKANTISWLPMIWALGS